MKQCFAVALLLMLVFVPVASGQTLADQYVRIYNLIQEGDTLNNNGQTSQALAKYTEAQSDLDVFQKGNPDWNVQIVSFRLNYLANQIATLNPKAPPPAVAVQSNVVQNAPQPLQTEESPNKVSVPSDWEQQLNSLKDRVSQLQNQLGQAQGDKSLLEAKLKEAFAAQPQGVDPRELERTQAQLKSVQKENDLLKVTLDTEKAKPRQADAKSLADAQKALAEANRQLALQTEKANSLASEKSFLQHKLSLLSTDSANSTALQSTRKALADANRQIIDQKSLSARLAAEKQTLQARLDAMSAANRNPTQESTSELAALRAENALLKKQLASTKEIPASSAGDLARELAETRVQLAALQSDKELWRLEKLALENRVRQLQATALAHGTEIVSSAAVAPLAAPLTARDAKTANRIKQLEQERDDLRKRLETANKELYAKKSQSGATKVEELQNQLASLQARLDAFEARQVPYTTEELALFKRPQPKLASADAQAQPAHQSIEQLSPNTAKLIVEARGYFSSAEYDKAEAAYLEAARQDEKNVPILANLAAIQIERGRFDSADTNVHKALTLTPNDPYSLFVLGNLKFRQGKYDEALEALSRAAKLDPSNAEVQNYLGLTLSEKGLRVPAETALRKAIDLDPNYGSAHNNLAVIYLTQQPPAFELARFHYEKALAAGAPHNPELEKMLEHKEGREKRASE